MERLDDQNYIRRFFVSYDGTIGSGRIVNFTKWNNEIQKAFKLIMAEDQDVATYWRVPNGVSTLDVEKYKDGKLVFFDYKGWPMMIKECRFYPQIGLNKSKHAVWHGNGFIRFKEAIAYIYDKMARDGAPKFYKKP